MRISHEPGRRLPWRLAVLLLLALLIFCFTAFGGPELLGVAAGSEEALRRVAVREPRIALTFDVTWGREQLDRILAVLDQHQVKATFFVGGTLLGLHPEAVRLVAEKGHEVGTLGQRIVDLSRLPEQEVTSNLLASQASLSRALGAPVRFFRPPSGPATGPVIRGASQAGLKTVTFSIDGEDHLGRSRQEVVRRVLRQARKGEVIRLTASDWSPATAEALPEILAGLRQRNLQVGPLAEMAP